MLVTRAGADARPLLRAIRARGGQALRLPGLALAPVADVAATRAALDAARSAEAWIVVSPAAVRFLFAALPDGALPPRVFAVGAGTRRALARRGIAAIVPTVRQDSEGLLGEPALADPRGWRIVLIGAPDGRGLLAPALRERGATVEELHVYRRHAPRLDRRHFEALAAAAPPLYLLVSSAVALTHLHSTLGAARWARLAAQTVVVPSARLATAARALGCTRVVLARSALAADLLAATAAAHAGSGTLQR